MNAPRRINKEQILKGIDNFYKSSVTIGAL